MILKIGIDIYTDKECALFKKKENKTNKGKIF